jgi:hypothetical protein
MKVFAWGILVVAVSCAASIGAMSRRTFQDPPTKIVEPERRQGHWVFGDDGHAHFCTGPTFKLGSFDGKLRAYATGCLGSERMVPLHE